MTEETTLPVISFETSVTLFITEILAVFASPLFIRLAGVSMMVFTEVLAAFFTIFGYTSVR